MLKIVLLSSLILHLVNCCNDSREKGFVCDKAQSGTRFYHDTKSGRCQPFFFLGCGGNANNFVDRPTCERSCLSSIGGQTQSITVSTGENSTTIVSACSLPTSALLQEAATGCKSTSDCAAGHKCSSNGVCCPTKDHICSLTPSNGNEATEFVHRGRYAWIPTLKNCIRFSYFGVNGNPNNFPSFKECVSFCGST
ncbi:hypothetical protein PFISCL1PPCAC_1507 [Pristionchus fissidentatus]|uniref:BPTI/Kunitz inhibitor domain-containing protein n=1 Tax=Pristionchus fissidentatus TaxID=1538716 RepID=A0AAV5UVN7_9BILA|nr:hypothetical protein PFISCL1PPCAC_1507 [Pristionchus fissidentatus]